MPQSLYNDWIAITVIESRETSDPIPSLNQNTDYQALNIGYQISSCLLGSCTQIVKCPQVRS